MFSKGERYIDTQDGSEHVITQVYTFDNGNEPVIEFMAVSEDDQGPLFWQIESERLSEEGYQPKFA